MSTCTRWPGGFHFVCVCSCCYLKLAFWSREENTGHSGLPFRFDRESPTTALGGQEHHRFAESQRRVCGTVIQDMLLLFLIDVLRPLKIVHHGYLPEPGADRRVAI